MRRLTPWLLVLAGCASAGPGAPPTSPAPGPVVIPVGDGAHVRLSADRGPARYVVDADPAETFAVLPAVYDALGLSVSAVDAGARRIGAVRQTVRRRLAGELLSRFVSCGVGLTGEVADQYRVRLTVRTDVFPAEGSQTAVYTMLEADATPSEGTSTERIVCRSTGRLEQRIATLAAQVLQT